ncbi:MAG: response regulator [Planctomycetota bacterium]
MTDFNMPGMDGTQFLGKAHALVPGSMGIMLTGKADLNMAIDAVNRGHIFRFLTKPCEPENFRACVDAGLENVRLRRAEKDLLEQTVRGSVEILSEILSLANPTAFGRANGVAKMVQHIASILGLEDRWQFETAALLSQIGCIAIPDEVLQSQAEGKDLRPSSRRWSTATRRWRTI